MMAGVKSRKIIGLDIVFANAGVAKYSRLGEITEDLYWSASETVPKRN